MCGVFDMEDGDFLVKMSNDMLMNSEGNLMQIVGDNMTLDLDSGSCILRAGVLEINLRRMIGKRYPLCK